jgi:hypothetical protein
MHQAQETQVLQGNRNMKLTQKNNPTKEYRAQQ